MIWVKYLKTNYCFYADINICGAKTQIDWIYAYDTGSIKIISVQ